MAPFRAQLQAPFLETLGRAARDVDELWDATAASTAVGSVVADARSHARPKIAPIFSAPDSEYPTRLTCTRMASTWREPYRRTMLQSASSLGETSPCLHHSKPTTTLLALSGTDSDLG